MRHRLLPINLRGLIFFVVILSVLATLANGLIVAYRIQRDALIHSTLDANSAYAAKVASSIGDFLLAAQSRLKFSAEVLSAHWDDPAVIRAEAMRLQAQDADFNSIVIVDDKGKVIQAYPDTLQIVGSTVRPDGLQFVLAKQRPLISGAYVSVGGNQVVAISQPIFNASGQFLGAIAGSVYLLKQSTLYSVISNHFHQEGTSAWVTDGDRRLLYHPDQKRIGQEANGNAAVAVALQGSSGSMQLNTDTGDSMLTGYAPVPLANWAVVVQLPADRALATLGQLLKEVFQGMIPAGIIGFGLVFAAAALIARPLRQLSAIARQLSTTDTITQLQRVHAWYHEASSIRQAMLTGVQLLQQKLGQLAQEAQSDPLTGLANRRAMTDVLELLEHAEQPYSLLLLDIDHFKRVNDSFGHDAGDSALQFISEILKRNSRAGDLACRYGGEEFVLVLPSTSKEVAIAIAERIRETVAASEVPIVGELTLSAGVACRGTEASTPEFVLRQADACLYRAKSEGRNRVIS
ncbi:sensor domain-containing diguanylate cyclase [Pseudomonas alkylphenolica]|uniref:sensor domain-containing diguanylate cyclase n=1 Tax=Pseudomonas alkylphenolica TaxID=237609 RepID=UPI0018D71228|nr:sensor domain-containing diguanylate cyclase [Pseudomonas alkylphenolica]MBH3428923.1 GGDEF domain-containing protein [Pseudomonas alkylphenolica]